MFVQGPFRGGGGPNWTIRDHAAPPDRGRGSQTRSNSTAFTLCFIFRGSGDRGSAFTLVKIDMDDLTYMQRPKV